MSMPGKLSIERMCQLAGGSRAGFYRSLQEQEPVAEDMAVRSAIQQIFVEHKRRYGYLGGVQNCGAAECWRATSAWRG